MNNYCETCEGPGDEFCAGPCDCCGKAVHCNAQGRCRDCEEELMALRLRAARIRELIEDNRKMALRYSIHYGKRGS